MKIINYGIFKKFYISVYGIKFWNNLNTSDARNKMVTATENNKPAVEGIESELEQTFGDSIISKYYKRGIGHMVRQFMEEMSYYPVKRAKIKNNKNFGSGTLYKKVP